MSDTCLLLTTCGSEETSEAIAEALVDGGSAASVTLLPRVRSFVAYQGHKRWEEEFQLLVYTTEEKLEAAYAAIQALHTYQDPPIFRVDLAGGTAPALSWLRKMGRG